MHFKCRLSLIVKVKFCSLFIEKSENDIKADIKLECYFLVATTIQEFCLLETGKRVL